MLENINNNNDFTIDALKKFFTERQTFFRVKINFEEEILKLQKKQKEIKFLSEKMNVINKLSLEIYKFLRM